MDHQDIDNLLKLLLAGASLTAGAYLTALRARLASTRKKNWLHISFYIVSLIVGIGGIVSAFKIHDEIFKPNYFAIFVLAAAITFSCLLAWATNKFLAGKHQYTINELNPVVNAFSKHADKGNLKLLAGNLDFFGKSMADIDRHTQYVCLKEAGFRRIEILCTEPITSEDKIRYGKIISDFPMAEMRYYKPSSADLRVRGRIKTINGVTRLLIYNKVSDGHYEALELNTAETDGALYSHLWNLIWDLAYRPSPEELAEYMSFYRS